MQGGDRATAEVAGRMSLLSRDQGGGSHRASTPNAPLSLLNVQSLVRMLRAC
jgi:hypothetical protein